MLWWRHPLLINESHQSIVFRKRGIYITMLDFLVLYSSTTGNTKMIATAIFNALPGTSKELCNIADFHYDKEAKLYFIGFWTNRGSCDMSILNLLSSLHEKKVALFGTCGMGNTPQYHSQIANSISAFISEDCEYLGGFICQGRMPIEVRKKYEQILITNLTDSEQIKYMLQNFDTALSHPDDSDLTNAQTFTENILGSCIT